MADDWITAASDIFPAVGTVGVFGIGFVLLRREHRREAERAEGKRRAQHPRSGCAHTPTPNPVQIEFLGSAGRRWMTRAELDD